MAPRLAHLGLASVEPGQGRSLLSYPVLHSYNTVCVDSSIIPSSHSNGQRLLAPWCILNKLGVVSYRFLFDRRDLQPRLLWFYKQTGRLAHFPTLFTLDTDIDTYTDTFPSFPLLLTLSLGELV
ncbi:uncharacterized protein BO66DRAFT_163844 [Aspergillus aculeatinus CBS 121060]|uniref:Uncharacterized protein n=1 Tax=Aspergillus aculeatinus CBS 121060 TaxID=1448322 RepID=A0ACD1GZX5_9EURO|nr:hypothetical protein BO66DRAFT_163844 [Aspergillus aculeatinus CBS 121060]RAH66911.1 hypothetical protein BO66DRAFT_163844 [Aspergillus aculeatinus CBS 121060]